MKAGKKSLGWTTEKKQIRQVGVRGDQESLAENFSCRLLFQMGKVISE